MRIAFTSIACWEERHASRGFDKKPREEKATIPALIIADNDKCVMRFPRNRAAAFDFCVRQSSMIWADISLARIGFRRRQSAGIKCERIVGSLQIAEN